MNDLNQTESHMFSSIEKEEGGDFSEYASAARGSNRHRILNLRPLPMQKAREGLGYQTENRLRERNYED